MRRIAVAVSLVVGVVVVTVLVANAPGTSERAAISPSRSDSPTPAPSATSINTSPPSQAPSPSARPPEAPRIDGLRFDVQQRAYVAEPGNAFGVEANTYAGTFRSNVVVARDGTRDRTGGVVLIPEVVLKLLGDKLAAAPSLRERWAIALPVDIRTLDEAADVTLSIEGGIPQIPSVFVRFPGSLPLVNVIPDTRRLRILKASNYPWEYIDSTRLVQPYTDHIVQGQEMKYISVVGAFQGFTQNVTIDSRFGDRVANAEGPVAVAVCAALECYDATLDKVLVAGRAPVFLASRL